MESNTIIVNDYELALIRRSLKIRLIRLSDEIRRNGPQTDPHFIRDSIRNLYYDLGGDPDGV
jgi:hypothetical protein